VASHMFDPFDFLIVLHIYYLNLIKFWVDSSTHVLGRRLFDMVRHWLREPWCSNRYAGN
jgi:hypothetical protein